MSKDINILILYRNGYTINHILYKVDKFGTLIKEAIDSILLIGWRCVLIHDECAVFLKRIFYLILIFGCEVSIPQLNSVLLNVKNVFPL